MALARYGKIFFMTLAVMVMILGALDFNDARQLPTGRETAMEAVIIMTALLAIPCLFLAAGCQGIMWYLRWLHSNKTIQRLRYAIPPTKGINS